MNREQENKDQLERKLKAIGADTSVEIVKMASDVLAKTESDIFDFDRLQIEVETQSSDTVKSIASFYFDFNELDISAIQMVKSRMSIDILSLHSVIYQMKTSDYAISQILNEVRKGFTNSSIRLLEALNGVQKTNLEATKTLASMITIFEQQYSALKSRIETELSIKNPIPEEESGIVRGSKAVIKNLHDLDDEIEMLKGTDQ